MLPRGERRGAKETRDLLCWCGGGRLARGSAESAIPRIVIPSGVEGSAFDLTFPDYKLPDELLLPLPHTVI